MCTPFAPCLVRERHEKGQGRILCTGGERSGQRLLSSPLLLFFAPVTSEASPGMGGNAERHDNVCSFTFFP